MCALSITEFDSRAMSTGSVPALKVSSVSKRYADNSVMEGINLTVEKGEFIALIGASGCGKPTLLRMCPGLEQPSSASIHTFSKPPVPTPSPHETAFHF